MIPSFDYFSFHLLDELQKQALSRMRGMSTADKDGNGVSRL